MTTYRARCLSCGVEMEPSYRYQNCPACRQLQATDRLYESQQQTNYNSDSGGYQGGGGFQGSGGSDDYDLYGKLLVCMGIVGVYWMWHPAWLVIKFFGSILLGIED